MSNGFFDRLRRAKAQDYEAQEWFLKQYKPLLLKMSYLYDGLDEDLFQECSIAFLHCIDVFELRMDE